VLQKVTTYRNTWR